MYNIVAKKTVLVAAPIPANPTAGVEYKFENLNDLSGNNIIIYGIQAYTSNQLVKNDNGTDVVDGTAAQGIVVNIQNTHNEYIHQYTPYIDFVKQSNNGVVFLQKPLKISLTNCSIVIFAKQGNVNAGGATVALFKLFYEIVK